MTVLTIMPYLILATLFLTLIFLISGILCTLERINKRQTEILAQLMVMRKEYNATAIDDLVAYILDSRISRQEPGFPSGDKTRQWMKNHGVHVQDRQALIYKYLEKAIYPTLGK